MTTEEKATDESGDRSALNASALASLEDLDDNISRDEFRVDASAMAIVNRSEVEMQITAAHQHPRKIKVFLQTATAMATITREVAESCIYTLPRGVDDEGNKKQITGPSVRLAEIMASSYGNLHVGARVLDADDKEIIAQGVAWDLEKNVRITVETRRRITNKKGKRFSDDMVTVTGNAAASIALRNAIFRIVPRSYVQAVYQRARAVAVGSVQTLTQRRGEAIANFNRLGVSTERVLERVGKAGVVDVGLEELETLIGIATAIRDHGATIEEHFPSAKVIEPSAGTSTAALEEKLRAGKTVKPKPAATVPDADSPPPDDVRTVGDTRQREPGED
jgi:hypothetical protein